MLKLWIDADACPRAVKEIAFRASNRLGLEVVLVANGPQPHPDSPLIIAVQVEKGFDVADAHIVRHVAPGDIVITADVPLAAEVVAQGAVAIDPRGDLYTADTIGERLPYRNLMMDLRDQGIVNGGGPPPFSPADRNRFASAFDALLTRRLAQFRRNS
jgi:hypothetical protein